MQTQVSSTASVLARALLPSRGLRSLDSIDTGDILSTYPNTNPSMPPYVTRHICNTTPAVYAAYILLHPSSQSFMVEQR